MDFKGFGIEVLILTAVFIAIDLLLALFGNGFSEVINTLGIFLIVYNFAWAVLIELLFRGAGFLIRKVIL